MRIAVVMTVLMAMGHAADASAQGTWDAILMIDPYPSPYYSDWDANPNISSLTLINSTASTANVRIHFNVIDRTNKVVVSGTSDPELIGAGATVIFDSPYDVAGSTTHDADMEEIASRTGRLPEGDYTACAAAADASGFVLAESCAMFTIVYPDPPLLLGPLDGDVIDQTDPLFLWTPVQVPIDYQLTYVLRVVEVLPNQTPAEALRSNIPHYQSFDGQMPSLRYPLDAQPLVPGKRYAWTVQALDQNGYAASANDGRSEIWSFTYEDATSPIRPPIAEEKVRLVVVNSDAADGESAVVRAAPEDYPDTLAEICTNWGQDVSISASTIIEGRTAFLDRIELTDARLVRADTLTGTNGRRTWAIYGNDPGRDVMVVLSGDCGVGNNTTRRRWVGTRPISDAEELANWLPASDDTHVDSIMRFKFGVRIFSWFQEKAGKGALTPVKEFLEDREIEIKPGVNYYGVVDLQAFRLWPLVSWIGPVEDGGGEVEFTAFAGADTKLSGNVSFGSEDRWAVGANGEAEVLLITAALPELGFPTSPIRKTRLGFELAFGISGDLGYDLGRTASSDTTKGALSTGREITLVGRVVGEAETANRIKWKIEYETPIPLLAWLKGQPDTAVNATTEHTVTVSTNAKWQPWSDVEVAIGEPSLKIKATPLKNAADPTMHGGLEGTLSGSLIMFDEKVATISGTYGRKADKRVIQAQHLVTLGHDLVDKSRADLRAAEAAGDTARIARAKASLERSERLLKRNADALAAEDAAAKKAKESNTAAPARTATTVRSDTYWKVKLSVGNMSLVNLLDLIQKFRLALP